MYQSVAYTLCIQKATLDSIQVEGYVLSEEKV